MPFRIGDKAPDFTAETTQGSPNLHQYLGDGWGLLFSHPKDFTPACTIDLGSLAQLEPEFTKRGVKLVGLSVDPVSDHARWLPDIKKDGSWWLEWGDWLARRYGEPSQPPPMGLADKGYAPIADAPGAYVLER